MNLKHLEVLGATLLLSSLSVAIALVFLLVNLAYLKGLGLDAIAFLIIYTLIRIFNRAIVRFARGKS
jgi:hypothetical protein